MGNLFFNNIKLVGFFAFNIMISLLYLGVYDTGFFFFVLALILLNFFVILFYLRHFCSVSFNGSKICYKGIFLSYNFDFDEIVSFEKRLSDNLLILKLKNKKKIKVCYWVGNGSGELFKELRFKRKDLFIPKLEDFPIRYYLSYVYLFMFLARIMISLFVYYISLSNIFIFLFICFIDIKVLLGDFSIISSIVLFYEFRKDSIYERRIFKSDKYFYKFFEGIFIAKEFEFSNKNYLCFSYKGNNSTKKVYILNKKISYSMQKVFEYIKKNYYID
ncbi:membrane protein [Borreliella chilensis]|uniref:Membrane protein n=1 Tax=Borreliella chilensis TaxID=1245910 RepID=A0A0A7UV57_9SPIR|nr:membrane protein [Borreliella chilensis]